MKRIGIFCSNPGCDNLAHETGGLCIECKRLAAVREVVRQSKHYAKVDGHLHDAIEALRAVWPEAVGE